MKKQVIYLVLQILSGIGSLYLCVTWAIDVHNTGLSGHWLEFAGIFAFLSATVGFGLKGTKKAKV